jgi:hypothetical protein
MSEIRATCISERLNKQISTWSGINGLLYADGQSKWTCAPVSPLPQRLKRSHYQYLTEIQLIWNKLIDKIARNRAFIKSELEVVAKVDPFTAKLLKIYDSIPAETLENSYQLGIFRSDYMSDMNLNRPVQVEINTISSGLAALSQKTCQLQNYLLKRNQNDEDFLDIAKKMYSDLSSSVESLPIQVETNPSLQRVASAMAQAHAAYGQPKAVVVFIVQPNERNVSDFQLNVFSSYLFHVYILLSPS